MLEDDAFRRGGSVTLDLVLRLGEKFSLLPEHLVEVRTRLGLLEIEIEGDSGDEEVPADAGSRPETGEVVPDQPDEPIEEPRDREFKDAVGAYLRETRQFDLLTREEEIALARRVRAGEAANASLATAANEVLESLRKTVEDGRKARTKLIESNLRLVVHFAKTMHDRGALTLGDLIQEGNLGLMRAVERFDHTREAKFSTYASWWIWSFMKRAIADRGSLVRLPVYLADRLPRLRRLQRTLLQESQRMPTTAELADHLGWPVEQVQFLLDCSLPPTSLDEPAHGDSRDSLGEKLAAPAAYDPESPVLQEEFREHVAEVVESLGDKLAAVVRRRFGLDGEDDRTLQDIGDEFGVTRERIRQIESQALEKLRHPRRSRTLKALVDDEERPLPAPPKKPPPKETKETKKRKRRRSRK